jgi:hypothetical protein
MIELHPDPYNCVPQTKTEGNLYHRRKPVGSSRGEDGLSWHCEGEVVGGSQLLSALRTGGQAAHLRRVESTQCCSRFGSIGYQHGPAQQRWAICAPPPAYSFRHFTLLLSIYHHQLTALHFFIYVHRRQLTVSATSLYFFLCITTTPLFPVCTPPPA